MPTVGVLLSGCGVYDGAEIHESVLTLLALDQRGARILCCAPDIQAPVIDHRTKEATGETRNVLTEAARIARGDIQDVANVTPEQLDALILPGGFGAAKNLCDFAARGPECDVNPAVEKLVAGMFQAGKPIGAICIAPALIARIAGRHDIAATVTIGDDQGTATAIAQTGCTHENRPVTDITVDERHKLVTTPAYMLGPGPADVHQGIDKLVERVLAMI